MKIESLSGQTTTTCYWKGLAHYFTLQVHGKENIDAAGISPDPKPAGKENTGYIAFR